jgi:hypothetical protein
MGSANTTYTLLLPISVCTYRGRIQRKTCCMGPYAGVDFNLTICPLQSRLQQIYHGQPYARVDLNPMPGSILSHSQGLWIWPQECRLHQSSIKKAKEHSTISVLSILKKIRTSLFLFTVS